MSSVHTPVQPTLDSVEDDRRSALETSDIARALADVRAGRVVDSSLVKAWIDTIGTERESPPPFSGR